MKTTSFKTALDALASGHTVKIEGFVRLVAHNKDGSLAWDTGRIKNKITRAGVTALVKLGGNLTPPAAFAYLAVGSGSGAEANTSTALGTEFATIGLSRAAATVSKQTTNFTDDTLRFVKVWTVSGGSGTINEIGIFNATPSGGDMLARKLTGAKTVESGMTVSGTYDIIFTIT